MLKSPLCSCVICKKQLHTKSFHTHYQRVHDNTQTNYKNKTANATKAARERSIARKKIAVSAYNDNPKLCITCKTIISYEKRVNKFCSNRCAAIENNRTRDHTLVKTGPKKGTVPANYAPYTRISRCIICEKYHSGGGKTCSKKCKSKFLSILTNKRIDAGWNPQENRNRSRPSFLESSFEEWLSNQGITEYIKSKTFRCGKKIYYGDFYFPNLGILIELDGRQHLQSVEYDTKRDFEILNHHGVYTIRVSYDEYLSKIKLPLITTLMQLINKREL